MTNYLITQMATAQGYVDNQSNLVYANIDANPGTTRALIAAALGISINIVNFVVDEVILPGRVITRENDIANLEHLWTAGDFASAVISNIAEARTWLTNNNNGTTQQLAAALPVAEGIAVALSNILARELRARLTPI